MATHTPFCWPSMRHTFSPNFSNTFSFDFGGYGAHLRRGIGVADHEMRTDRSIESREVQRYNILTFFIFNRADDRFDQFIHKCSIGIYNLAKV